MSTFATTTPAVAARLSKDDEIPPAKAYALVQVLQLSYRAIEMCPRMLVPNPIELPASMSHLIEQPKPAHASDQQSASNTAAEDTNADNPAAQPPARKKPSMTPQEFEPWRQILLSGNKHPQYQQALEKYDEYADAIAKSPSAESA